MYALQREYEGKRFFETNAERLNHAAAVSAFKQLAAEEQKHIDFIQGLISNLDQGQDLNIEAGIAMEKTGFFSQRAETEMIEQTVSEAMVPDLPILRMAYLIERDFSEFYELTAQKVEDNSAQRTLLMLAQWERIHERLFKHLHDAAFENYSQMPWGG
jgi:rubrerythrin